jgi:hypothetical protein
MPFLVGREGWVISGVLSRVWGSSCLAACCALLLKANGGGARTPIGFAPIHNLPSDGQFSNLELLLAESKLGARPLSNC